MRQRRNRTSTRAVLTVVDKPHRIPPLPNHRDWHKLTRAWWKDVWRSPMAGQYLESDKYGLYILAELIERFWRAPAITLSAEIRTRAACYGLSPMDRLRLQWEIQQVEQTKRETTEPSADGVDPRRMLSVLK